MTEPDNPPLIEFPCEFPVKIMGKTHEDFTTCVQEIFLRHVPDFNDNMIKVRPSGKGNYSAITVTIQAQNQAQLDAIYHELSANKLVLMAL